MNRYEQARNVWENTKPIRGRAVDVRPIGKRKRDWETIVKVDLGADKPQNERYAYAAKLHNTNVITWYPDNTIGITADTWHSPTTAKFIHEHSPLSCGKANRKLWVWNWQGGDNTKYPVPYKDELRMQRKDGANWVPMEGYAPKVRRVDRKATKPIQQQVAPFLNWAKAFLAMSDGAIHPETYAQVLENKATIMNQGKDNQWTSEQLVLPSEMCDRLGIQRKGPSWYVTGKPADIVDAMCKLTDDDYLPFLCFISLMRSTFQPLYVVAVPKTNPVYVYYDKLKEWVYKNIRALPESGMQVEFVPSAKFAKGAV